MLCSMSKQLSALTDKVSENHITLASQPADAVLTAAELTARLKISRGALRAYMAQGKIPYFRLGPRRYSFIWPDVFEALRRQQSQRV
jgi:hypothetical protein